MANSIKETTYGKAQLGEYIEELSGIKYAISACVGQEIENEGLAARIYSRVYILQDILSGAKRGKGAEERYQMAKRVVNTTLEMYYKRLSQRAISQPLQYMETTFSKLRHRQAA